MLDYYFSQYVIFFKISINFLVFNKQQCGMKENSLNKNVS